MENHCCVLVFIVLMAIWQSGETGMMPKSRMCMRYPVGTRNPPSPGDNGYEIRVTEIGGYRRIRQFQPGRTYEVMIRNILPFVSFKKFYLTAELSKTGKKAMMNDSKSSEVGNFVHMANPPVTTNVNQCPGVVTTIYRRQMDKVKLRWTAPVLTRDCIMFKATVEKYPGVYFKDEGKLSRLVCPKYVYASDEGAPEKTPVDTLPVIKECCACGTATYKMKFQGKWIRQLHPKDWPANDAFAHWTSIIGATHNQEYFLYHLGGMATAGVVSVCRYGDVSVLEGEFKDEAGSNVLNIIKTRGILGGQNLGESRTAIFAVNRTHHLMSMLTMLGPSPDWCTGISAYDLCKSDCTWRKNVTMDLYPWDAGVQAGNTYMPKIVKKETQKPIMPITAKWPAGNPFTVINGKIRPVASVTIERLSPVKDYQCDKKAMAGVRKFKSPQNDDDEQFGRPGKTGKQMDGVKSLPPNLQSMVPTMCFMTPWSTWSPCSVTCGTGTSMRKRIIKRNLKPPLCKHVKLKESKECTGSERTCNYDKLCSVTEWSTWSPCNATCKSAGVALRTRSFIREKEKAKCSHVKAVETMKCQYRCDDSLTCSAPMVEGFRCFTPVIRYYYNLRKKKCLPFTYLGCKGSKNRFKSKKDCHRVCDNAFNSMAKWLVARTAQLQEDATRKKKLASKGKSSMSCKQPMNEGHRCRRRKGRKGKKGPKTFWYFNMKAQKCQKLKYKGCSGNDNNFESETDCITTCRKFLKMDRMITGPPQDCKVSSWGPWGPCKSKCGGRRRRERRVIRAQQNGGRPCPRRVEFGYCPRQDCRPCAYSPWSGWSPCTTTCGSGVMERTRSRLPTSPKECTPVRPEFTERSYCTNKPCPLSLFNYRKV